MTIRPDLNALNEYIRKVRNIPFQWHVNDCFMFTNNAYKAMYGEGWAEDWEGKYTKGGMYLKRDALRKTFNAQTLEEAIDTKLTRIDYTPPKGALVTTDKVRRWVINQALGISVGSNSLFVSDKGIVSIPTENVTNSWIKT